MASWITDEKGLWHPAKERASLVNRSGKTITITQTDREGKEFKQDILPDQEYIYEGPDRAALFELWQIDKTGKTTTLGENFRRNTEFLDSYAKARAAFGFNTVDEYLQYIGYEEKEIKEDFQKKASIIAKHELPKRIAGLQELGGGRDTVGSQHRLGAFGSPKE